ncbi:hypothetical protein F4604DRAFT_1921839 [Suillus subluteus]|nr:hypothetical protein F4604DRAFT_1921839 [Suillus subluteus]
MVVNSLSLSWFFSVTSHLYLALNCTLFHTCCPSLATFVGSLLALFLSMLKARIPRNKVEPSVFPAAPAEPIEAEASEVDEPGDFDEETAIAVAENALPSVCISSPSNEQVTSANDALFSPLYPNQGQVREHFGGSVPSSVTPTAT